MTASEIRARQEERMLDLQPVMERIQKSFYADNATLLDIAKRYDPNGSMLPVIEVLSQRNPLLQDMVWKGPAPIGHKILMGSPPNWLKGQI